MATIKDVARAADVSTATVSAVINDSAYVSADLRGRVLAAVKDLNYAPSLAARNLKHGRSQLIALVVADLANPFFARMVWAAEAAVAAWGYSLLVFNSDEKPEPRSASSAASACWAATASCWCRSATPRSIVQRDPDGKPMPTVLFGRTVEDDKSDTVTIDNISAGRAGDGLSARSRPYAHRHDHRSAARVDRQGPARRHARGDEGARAGAASRACPLRRVPRGCGLFGGAQPAGSSPTGRPRSMSQTA